MEVAGIYTMNTRDIEELATNAVKKSILTSKLLSANIYENDKNPLWDGEVYIYKSEQKTNADFCGKVPLQIKGKRCANLSKNRISFPVEVNELNNYLCDGGVMYFVVYVADDGHSAQIYYAALTPVGLKELLRRCRIGQHRKSISLSIFPEDAGNKTDIFYKFNEEYKRPDKPYTDDTKHQKKTSPEDEQTNRLKPYSLMVSRYLNRYVFEQMGELLKKDMYLPGRYSVEGNTDKHDDIMQLIAAFLSGTLKQWFERQRIVPQRYSGQTNEDRILMPDLLTTLIIEGSQCTGKSTLIAQIIYNIDVGVFPSKSVHLLSFSDRELRSNSMTCKSICDHLGIQPTELNTNALLLIDAIDESDWSRQDANNRIGNLVNELCMLDCKVLIACRSGYLDIEDDHILSIHLHRFSEQQGLDWLKLYQKAFPQKDISKMQNYVHRLLRLLERSQQSNNIEKTDSCESKADNSPLKQPLTKDEENLLNTADIILMPHVMELCIRHQVNITNEKSLAQIYSQVFLPETNNSLLRNQYSVTPKYISLEDAIKIFDAATHIAIRCMGQPEHIISENEIATCIIDPKLISIVCTQYLLTKSLNGYSFTHQSIPAFLIARYIFNAFSSQDNATDESILHTIREIIESDGVLTELVQENIRYFAQEEHAQCAKRISGILSRFLAYELCTEQHTESVFSKRDANRRIWCDAILRLYSVFCIQDFDKKTGIPFFQRYTADERKELIYLLAHPQVQASKAMGFCELRNMELDGINLKGADLYSRYIYKMQMHKAMLCDCNLSDAYVIDCDLSLSYFDNTKSKVVQYHNSILCGCSFKNAILNGAVFTNCNLANADIRGAHVFKTKFENCIFGGMKVDVRQLKDLLFMDHNYILQHRIQVYLDNELLLGKRFLEEYKKVRPIRSISVPNQLF